MDFDAKFFADGRLLLSSAVLSDILDVLGRPLHAIDPKLRPIDDKAVLFGRVRTGQYVDVFERIEGVNPYAVEIALIDDLQPDDVAVLNCTGTERYAAWGELLTTAAKMRGAAGAVIDGQTRDVGQIREADFPVFARSIGMLDAAGRGEMRAYDVPVECGGVPVAPGDLIFGDLDGLVIIPNAVAEEAIHMALEKIAGEDKVRAALLSGEKLTDVFQRFGIL